MKNYFRLLSLFMVWLLSSIGSNVAYAKRAHAKAPEFKINIPNTMRELDDTATRDGGERFYFDTTNNIVLIISGRESQFNSVNDYIDGSNEDLEQKLQTAFGDSTVKLISCARSKYCRGRSAVVRFTLTDDKNGLDTYVVYFIHDKNEDLQISFMYSKQSEQQSTAYVDGVMQTFKLK